MTGRIEGEKVILAVEDNGIGMSEEQVRLLLTDSGREHKHGSGVGLVNVNNRLQLLFGKEYGLTVESEPDEGTRCSLYPGDPLYRRKQENPRDKDTGSAEKNWLTDRTGR